MATSMLHAGCLIMSLETFSPSTYNQAVQHGHLRVVTVLRHWCTGSKTLLLGVGEDATSKDHTQILE